jgi:hypothetical protein
LTGEKALGFGSVIDNWTHRKTLAQVGRIFLYSICLRSLLKCAHHDAMRVNKGHCHFFLKSTERIKALFALWQREYKQPPKKNGLKILVSVVRFRPRAPLKTFKINKMEAISLRAPNVFMRLGDNLGDS